MKVSPYRRLEAKNKELEREVERHRVTITKYKYKVRKLKEVIRALENTLISNANV